MRMRILKNSRVAWIMLCAVLLLDLEGCGKAKEPPEDTPWNNGYDAIMETDTGYYSNLRYFQCLRYYEKGTDTQIMLCTKPECLHDGKDSCTATYQDLMTVNTVLYEDRIYFLALGERDGVAGMTLYSAALDGSSLDKVGDVIQERNVAGSECYYNPPTTTGEPAPFIIHKGYAYIPYMLAFQWSLKGFVDGGIMKMDLKTGKTEQIYAMEKLTSAYPWNLRGCGNYVYFDKLSSGGSSSGTMRYDLRDGSVDDCVPGKRVIADAVTREKIYIIVMDEDSKPAVGALDSESGEWLGSQFAVDAEDDRFSIIPYEEYILICCPEKLMVYGGNGEKLGELEYQFADDSWFEQHGALYTADGWYSAGTLKNEDYRYTRRLDRFALKVSRDKVYAILDGTEGQNHRFQYYAWPVEAQFVFSCPLKDILDGSAEWQNEYNVPYWQTVNPGRYVPQDTRNEVKEISYSD